MTHFLPTEDLRASVTQLKGRLLSEVRDQRSGRAEQSANRVIRVAITKIVESHGIIRLRD
jgi:hypothetical protein